MRVLHSISWVAGGDVAARLMTLLTTLVVARALAPADFGVFLALLAGAILATVALDAGVIQLVSREIATGALRPGAAFWAATRTRSKTGIPWLLLFVGVLLISSTHVTLLAGAAFLGYSAAASFSVLLLAILRSSARFRDAAGALLAGRFFTLVGIGASNVVGIRIDLSYVGMLFAVGELVTITIAIRLVTVVPPAKSERVRVRAALPFLANSALATAYNRCDVILVAALAGGLQLSLYGPASRLQDGLYVLPGAVGAVALPMLARCTDERERTRRALRMSALGVLIAIPVVLAVEVAAGPLAGTVFGSGYRSSADAIRILAWFLPLAMFQAPLLAALIVGGRAVDTTKVFAVTFGVAMTAHLVLDPHWGAQGAAVASLTRDVVAAPFVGWLVLRRNPAASTRSAATSSVAAGTAV